VAHVVPLTWWLNCVSFLGREVVKWFVGIFAVGTTGWDTVSFRLVFCLCCSCVLLRERKNEEAISHICVLRDFGKKATIGLRFFLNTAMY
jgi:hypothetical protein